MSVITDRPLGELTRGQRADVHVVIDEVITRRTRNGQPFVILRVSDRSAAGTVYLFPEHNAFAAAADVQRGDVVKLRVTIDKSDDRLEMKGLELRSEREAPAEVLDAIFGPLRPEAVAVAQGDVGFDIETTPRLELDELPRRERDKFRGLAIRDARRETGAEVPGAEYIEESARKFLALHPLTTKVVSIGFHSLTTGCDLVLVTPEDAEVAPPALALDETELLRTFWALARRVRSLIGFNSLRFDVPVLLARSALLGIKASVDLQSARFDRDSRHVDLYDVLRARGAAGDRRVSLELAAFAFGIPVKQSGHGSEVAELYAEGRLQELAAYNLEDARATAQLYEALRGTWVD